jgi:glycosyltransferase involved in cell wall biosynthesis
MRIAVDARAFFMRTGIARYTRAMIAELAAKGVSHEWLLLISDRHEISDVPDFGAHVRVAVSSAPWLGGARERRQLAAEARAWRAEAFYSIFPPIAVDGLPSLVTIFDCIPWSHPHLLPPRVVRAFRAASKRALANADRVVAISNATAAQVERWFPAAAGKVSVAPCGLSRELEPAGLERDGGREGVLFVGTIEPRKNVPLIVRAARALPQIPFTIVGKPGWGSYDLATDVKGLPNVTWLSRVEDEELRRLYRQAAVLVYPSVVEGFGLPVLEAIASGVLPIVSTASALVELVPDRELQVDPSQPFSLTRVIQRWVADGDARTRRVDALSTAVSAHTWAAAASTVLGALEQRAG